MNETKSNIKKRRLPAEWENPGAILLSWPHKDTDWAPMLEDAVACFKDLAVAIAGEMPVIIVTPEPESVRSQLASIAADRLIIIEAPTNDTWARDFGPITVRLADGQSRFMNFKFNGWGLKFAADRDNLINDHLFASGILNGDEENRMGFVLEGGSIDSDGKGAILTTSECLLSRNRNPQFSREDIGRYLCDAFGAERVLWLDHGYLAGDDTDSHVDTLARFAPEDTILYVKCDNPDDEHYADLAAMEEDLMNLRTADGRPYNLIGLPMPDAIYDEDGQRLPATYANFLVTDRTVYMPMYGQPKLDRLASQILKIAFPDHDVKAIDCRALIRQHGSLHCVTMQIPKVALNILDIHSSL